MVPDAFQVRDDLRRGYNFPQIVGDRLFPGDQGDAAVVQVESHVVDALLFDDHLLGQGYILFGKRAHSFL